MEKEWKNYGLVLRVWVIKMIAARDISERFFLAGEKKPSLRPKE